ncbi:MAG: AAA family ATPase, partial [Pseudomonadota bacterium]
LNQGLAFGRPGRPVEQIDTHAAIIFLIDDRAYKLKRAIRYSFLDFSTIEKRRRVLNAEYRLNVKTAPGLYRGLVPVAIDDNGQFALGGDGRIIDWLLEMKRFDQTALLDHVAEQGKLDTPLIKALAKEIAEQHQNAPVQQGGGYAAMASIIDGNAADLRGLIDQIEDDATTNSLIKATRSELGRQHRRLDARARTGFVRHCHGDLHLGNIFLDNDRPVLFDCLEFDESLATIDVVYDLAFLLMDLCHRKLDSLAIDLLHAYLERTQDDDGTALLPLFLGVRATIRAKIEAFEIKTARSDTERQQHRLAAIQYLDLAMALLNTEPPQLIAIGGLSGTGKSTVARLLAHRLGPAHWPVLLRSDVIRKRRLGVEPTARLDADAYSRSQTKAVYQHLGERAATLICAGRTVIADATFLDLADRKALEGVALDLRVPFRGVWLDAPKGVLESRIQMRTNDASDADVSILAQQRDRDVGAITWTLVDANDDAPNIARTVQSKIAR